MDVATQKRNAKSFIKNWENRGHERQDSQSFWLQLLRDVLGVKEPEQFIAFEDKVMLTHDSFIDGYIEQTHVLIEQKGSNKDLDKPIKQSDGSLLTPFQQAQRYANALPYSKRARWIVTCNFKEFRVYDMEHPNSEPTKIELKDLASNYYQLDFLVDKSNQNLEKEKKVSLSAGELVGEIYDELLKQYKNPSDEHTQKSINQLCVRIVFCLYAEDAGIFGRKNMFHDYLENFEPHQIRQALIRLFRVLDTKEEDRDPYLADDYPKLAEFPYVNGGMFSDEDVEIPPFTQDLKNLLLRKASDEFDWSQISPTIFGAVFESTLNPETRRQGGMHYTSVENIHKVIDPLFLNDLKDELNEIKQYRQPATLKKKAQEFQNKLANLTFLDPACGSGNFLTETYLQLRKLENEAIKLIYPNPTLDVGQTKDVIKVSIQQFYGIEINDFAVSVAKTALWIAESQMMEETEDIFYANWEFLPLKTFSHIHEGDALKINWNDIIENYGCDYIISNPPFVGASLMNKKQKAEAVGIFGKRSRTRSIDYVGAWYYKAAAYIQKTNIQCCFVSTNSITQGEQVQPMWSVLLEKYRIHINFAYRTFIWNSEAKSKAAVHCVIIGFSLKNWKEKWIYTDQTRKKANNINCYLIDAPDILIKNSSKPIVKNIPRLTEGNKPSDGGNLLLSKAERNSLIRQNNKLIKVIKPYLNAKDFLHNNRRRYCLWLKDVNPSFYLHNKFIKDRLEKVKKFREKSSAKPTREAAKTPFLFFSAPQKKGNYLCIPATSSERRRYIPIGFENENTIASNAVLIISNATLYEFGILESNVHMAWMRTVAGRLEMRYRYSGSIVYNTFPWPNATEEQENKISKTAQEILNARKLYPNSSLADLYDPLTMPPELLKAHQDNDRAVMQAYGMNVRTTTESGALTQLFKMYERLVNSPK